VTINSIPDRAEVIGCDWLSQALGVKVAECRVEDAHSGTTGRAVLGLKYLSGGAGPNRLFVKLPPVDSAQQDFVASSGMGRHEARFYREIAPGLPVRAPRCYYSDWSDDGEHYIMLLEHLQDSGCTFRNASTRYSLDYVRSVLDSFAHMHANYWESERFKSDLQWLRPPLQHDIGRKLVARALDLHGETMPGIFTSIAELYLSHTDAIHQLWNRGAHTLIHGDVHDGNLFFDGDKPGFLDWAVASRGPGMRDVGYFLAGTLKPEDHHHHLDLLEYYRQQLLAHGVSAPALDELLLQYSWHAVYVWVGATVTLAMGDAWQPSNYVLRSMGRLHNALEQVDSLGNLIKYL
jgi:thiamine kinase-like enzyme